MDIFDLFISYRRSQAMAVRAAVACLEQAGIRCFLDEAEIEPLADFPDEVRGAIQNAKALLIWWSADYAESEHCLAELTLGWQFARAQSSNPGQRLWLVNPEPSAGHICAGELQSSNWLTAASFSDAAVVTQLKQRIDDLKTPLSAEPLTVAASPSYGVQQHKVSAHFTGRQRELWQLRSLLHPAKISQSNCSVAIQTHGMAGIGKTELARAYVDKFSAAYPGGVFWLNLAPLDSEAQVDDNSMRQAWANAVREALDWGGLSSFYRDSAGQYLEAQQLWEKLQQQGPWQGQPVLWLLDNLPVLSTQSYQQLQKWLTAPMASNHTLVTTRFGGELYGFQPLSLKPLGRVNALRLLRSYRDFTKAEQALAEQLVQHTGAHTLALVLAGEHLKHSSYQKLVEEFTAQQVLPSIEQIAATLQPDLGAKALGIVATFALTLKRLDTHARYLLALACQCEGNSAFPLAVLKDAAQKEFQLNEMQSNAALRQLFQASLVQQSELLVRNTEGNTYHEPMLELHPLSIAASWHLLSEPQDFTLPTAAELQQQLITLVRQQFESPEDNRHHPQIRPYLPMANFLPQQHQSAAAFNLRQRLELFYYYAGQLQNARAVAMANVKFFTEVVAFPPEHDHVLTSKSNLASTLKAQGDLSSARSLEEAVLEARERTLGAEHPDTLSSKNNLANTLWQQGDFDGARSLEEAVLEARERTLGAEHPNTLSSKNNLADTLRAQGDLDGARRLQEAVLEALKRTLGAEHPNTLASKNNLASTLKAQGDLAGARSLEEAVLEARERILGAEHPNTLTSKNNLASTLQAQGDLASARLLQEAVLEALERTLGAEHPNTLVSKNNLASTLWQQGDLVGALSLEEAVLETSDRILGAEHPDTLTSKHNLAFILRQLQDLPGALDLLQQAYKGLVKRLGQQHPTTLGTGKALLSLMLEMDMHQEAEVLAAELRLGGTGDSGDTAAPV
ncbi:MAG: toll/interleukin-1 receptor domain-containing protein [Gammaproteobacteria bacterium]|nr:toll/interleukin-1 receptor domain-containing protein [Gammaproteobacteria bacterium]MBU2057701.1 toll/interleukin-1 receptor domain-containing protein [Gammaproteobacteria bacterium]MBU2176401.1 toll/interleukin-1 receptor domain-containing protein [Gammaproteobacteria bacterium]MBU2246698.1 toll/interleukin-1 receptor domain-containing protein [Gammaproteobacteria bacterium]MBU2345078.1 toll/interleukin-1 receptor domain-containing protein [Gammaproteobacteria bacterium]